ncbi:arginine biosynthesis bifunctional protein ArgJ beta chain [Rhizophagus irregularis DAOM 181602=DAOM 197198]|nr:arginine biosynthesis bifunctional protein ArgJ beta chain [Rhizophagus irregularis DAOM 181602=DAOM 197198]
MAGTTKGAGMIHPNMATLLATVVTDVSISPKALNEALKYAVDRSFNSISIDNDMSTNDTFAVFANGAATTDGKVTIDDINGKDFKQFRDDLTEFAADLAKLVVRDGEGATKFVTIHVKGAKTYTDAKQIASTISTSSLVKTALYGQDANWGRILCAVGYAGVSSIIPNKVSVSFIPTDGTTPLRLLNLGEPENVNEERASEILAMEDLEINVDLGIGNEEAKMWTCDYSHEYITINVGCYKASSLAHTLSIKNIFYFINGDHFRTEKFFSCEIYSEVEKQKTNNNQENNGNLKVKRLRDKEFTFITLCKLYPYFTSENSNDVHHPLANLK